MRKLPDDIYVQTTSGSFTLNSSAVDVLDNDYDLMVNSYRTYAYVGPHNRVSSGVGTYDALYINNQIPSTRDESITYNSWRYFDDFCKTGATDGDGSSVIDWAEADRNDPLFLSAHNRSYHDINVNAVFGGIGNIRIFFVDQNGVARDVSAALLGILQAPNALHITCSGEPVSEITGRAAVHITDEAGKANLNTAGGFVLNDTLNNVERALNKGVSSFEYDTRVLPATGLADASHFWGMRTGAQENNYDLFTCLDSDYTNDISFPGYGLVDDNGNALLLSMTGRDDSGLGIVDAGLRLAAPVA